jgi:hypothetical protein
VRADRERRRKSRPPNLAVGLAVASQPDDLALLGVSSRSRSRSLGALVTATRTLSVRPSARCPHDQARSRREAPRLRSGWVWRRRSGVGAAAIRRSRGEAGPARMATGPRGTGQHPAYGELPWKDQRQNIYQAARFVNLSMVIKFTKRAVIYVNTAGRRIKSLCTATAAESFFATLKEELVYRTAYPAREKGTRDIVRYIELR